MSLLIDALKKHRQESTPASHSTGQDVIKNASSSRVKKIILVALIVMMGVSLTAIVSILIFKHVAQKRIVHGALDKIEQIRENNTASPEGLQEGLVSHKPPIPNEFQEQLQQKLKQINNHPIASAMNNIRSTNTGVNGMNKAPVDSPPNFPAPPMLSSEPSPPQIDASLNKDSGELGGPVMEGHVDAMDRSSQSDHVPFESIVSNDEASAVNDNFPAPRDVTKSESDDNESSKELSLSDETNLSIVNNVNIHVVPDQMGANNPTYQKALTLVHAKQYNQALPLLVDDDELLIKTEGLSALLLARIYLATAQYDLVSNVIDHALMLHVGSEVDLLSLKAQALFMQKRYQEVVDVLSIQSPDLAVLPEYYTLLANAYMQLNQPNNAVSVFQQIVAHFPNSAHYWLGLAVAYQKTGDANSALVAYRRAAQLSSNDPQVMLFINQQIESLQAK